MASQLNNRNPVRFENLIISLVWLINGLFCKVLDFEPRHQQIVGTILDQEHARALTLLIGLAEILMAAWILTGFKSRFNAITQIVVVITMNIIEFVVVPDLLLWGRLNLVFAVLFAGFIYYTEFVRYKKAGPQI
ncbi:DoxX-like family protein [Sphingobacterium spiritivorum]|uniref:DoxX-like family protein n=1 Tax=Sphingobacterium spiritivorum TaxID=258 RepID=UPI001918EDEF|nr:DoxX-like family protein [Sphingobacterium spiritivorum]QQT26065.1 DoxX-like family protein [Sphingobacterium spiritivorum]